MAQVKRIRPNTCGRQMASERLPLGRPPSHRGPQTAEDAPLSHLLDQGLLEQWDERVGPGNVDVDLTARRGTTGMSGQQTGDCLTRLQASHLSVGVSVVLLCPGPVVLLYESKVLLPLALKDQLSAPPVGWQVALQGGGGGGDGGGRRLHLLSWKGGVVEGLGDGD